MLMHYNLIDKHLTKETREPSVYGLLAWSKMRNRLNLLTFAILWLLCYDS